MLAIFMAGSYYFSRMKKLYILNWFITFCSYGGTMAAVGGGVKMNIDREFEDFVRKNYKKLTQAERKICEQLGLSVPC